MPATTRTPRQRLAPEIAAGVEGLELTINEDTIAAFRSFELSSPPLSDAVERRDHAVAGDPPVAVRVHRPVGADGLLPCMLSMHGGGYVIGSHAFDDPMFDQLCPSLGMVGVSVDYRLAPETPYPGPLEDCYRALLWVHGHADELGVDRARIGVRGVSAGGGLAAALAILARDRGEVAVAFQLLDCPMLDDRQITHSIQLDDLPVWGRESTAYGWRSYLGVLAGTDGVPGTAAAAREADLAGLPPAFVSVGAVDGFVDEDVNYAMALNRAGVDTELHVYPGACHAYQRAEQSCVAQQSRNDIERWLAARFAS